MAVVSARTEVDLPAERAFELWTDVGRWPTFIDDFAHVERLDEAWPAEGAKLVWTSRPHGRGRVTQKVTGSDPPRMLATLIVEERLSGTWRATFEPAEANGSVMALELDYRLSQRGPVGALTDFFFIRRALRDSLARTCRRFASEAAEEGSL